MSGTFYSVMLTGVVCVHQTHGSLPWNRHALCVALETPIICHHIAIRGCGQRLNAAPGGEKYSKQIKMISVYKIMVGSAAGHNMHSLGHAIGMHFLYRLRQTLRLRLLSF